MNTLTAYGSDDESGEAVGPAREAGDGDVKVELISHPSGKAVGEDSSRSSSPANFNSMRSKLGIKRNAPADKGKAAQTEGPESHQASPVETTTSSAQEPLAKRPRLSSSEDLISQRDLSRVSARQSTSVPEAFATAVLPPANTRGDRFWGLPQPVEEGADPVLRAKLAEFHRLKGLGTHFNASLASNRAFRNPHIYAKLVSFVELDECASNFPTLASTRAWDPRNARVQAEGSASKIAELQRKALEEKERAQKAGLRDKISFVGGSTNSREPMKKSADQGNGMAGAPRNKK